MIEEQADEVERALPRPASRRSKWRARLVQLVALAVFVLALWILRRTLGAYKASEVLAHLARIAPWRIATACALTAVAYLSLAGYDWLGVRSIGQRLRVRRVALASIVAYGFSNNFSAGGLASTTLRYRVYSTWGLTAVDVARIFVFTVATSWFGYFTIAGLMFALAPAEFEDADLLPASLRLIGVAMLSLLLAFSAWSMSRRRPLALRGFELQLPGPRMQLAMLAFSASDWIATAGALFVLLPPSPGLSFARFVGVYLLAQVIAAVSHVPGGLGVLESGIVLLITPSPLPADAVLGSLLAFRAIYYLAPLCVAAIALGAFELRERRRRAARALTSDPRSPGS